LVACGDGAEKLDSSSINEFVEQGSAALGPVLGAARPSQSAAELVNDYTDSLSYAQSLASSNSEGVSEANNPLAVLPNTPASATPSDTTTVTNPSEGSGNDTPAINTTDQGTSVTPINSIPTTGSTSTEPPASNTNPVAPAEGVTTNAPVSSSPTPGSLVDETPSNTVGSQFQSETTDGFIGQVLNDGTVKINWNSDPTARGYNIYRQAEYITTVFDTEYIDADIFDTNYYYEIQAFDFADNFSYVATGLTVKVRGLGKADPNKPVANAALLQDYSLVFSDEFDSGTLDSSKWNTAYLWGSELVINNEEQYYVDVNNK